MVTATAPATGLGRDAVERLIDASPIRPRQTLIFVLCGLVALADGFDAQLVSFVASAVTTSWKLDEGRYGLIVALGLVGTLIGVIVQGPIADRYGRKPVICAGTCLFALATLACAFAPSAAVLASLRLVNGIGLGAAAVNVITLTGEYAPRRVRSTIVALTVAGLPLGAFLSGISSAWLIPTYGWRSTFIVGGVFPLLLLPALLLLLLDSPAVLARRQGAGSADPRAKRALRRLGIDLPAVPVEDSGEISSSPSPRRNEGSSIKALFADGKAASSLRLMWIFFGTQFAALLLMTWLPFILQRAGLTMSRAILLSTSLTLGSVAGSLLLSRAADRWGRVPLLLVAYGASSVLCVLAGLAIGRDTTLLATTLFLLGSTMGAAQSVAYTLAVEAYPAAIRAQGMGLVVMAARVGAIGGPALGGLLLKAGLDDQILFLWVAAPLLLAGAAAWAEQAPARRHHQ